MTEATKPDSDAISPESYAGRTDHRNMFSRPDIFLGDDARWCGVCHCWDLGLIADDRSGAYTHPYHWIVRDGDVVIVVDGKPVTV